MRRKGGRGRSGGFTLVELVVSLVIMGTMLLGVGAVIPRMLHETTRSGVDFLSLSAVEDRIAMIQMDPRYTRLDSIYAGVEATLPNLPGFERRTEIDRTVEEQLDGRTLDFTEVSVIVVGDAPARVVGRTVIVGAP